MFNASTNELSSSGLSAISSAQSATAYPHKLSNRNLIPKSFGLRDHTQNDIVQPNNDDFDSSENDDMLIMGQDHSILLQ